jgi:multiple sugar transport system ATP-binding protein
MANVNLRKLNINLGGKSIIRDLDLQVEPGEFLVLLGPSGCGKSTLLHSIAGLVDADSGAIEIGGRDMTDADPSERGIGMVFQSYALYPTMSVEDNMSFGLRIAGTPKAEIKRRVTHAAEMLQLDALLDRKPSQLSGGQRQRVAIGRALVREAQVFLFDEPLSNLDAKLRAELRRELKLLHQKLGSTMIYVTHDQVEAMTLASRIVVMEKPARCSRSAPRSTSTSVRPTASWPASWARRRWPSSTARWMARALHGGRTGAGAGRRLLRAGPGARPAVLGVRPEHVAIRADGPMAGTVSLVEPMGNHQVVWIRCGAHTAGLAGARRQRLCAGPGGALCGGCGQGLAVRPAVWKPPVRAGMRYACGFEHTELE